MTTAEREQLHEAIDGLSDGSLKDFRVFIDYLKYTESLNKAWFSQAYDLFAPVREEILASGMTEEEVNAAIDQAIAEVRGE